MEHLLSAALIQQWLPDPSEHDPSSRTQDELVSSAFQCILSNFAKLVEHLKGEFRSEKLLPLVDTLRSELERLYLWGQGISFKTLGTLLAEEDDISLSVLVRLYELGTAILKALLPAIVEVCTSALQKVDSNFVGLMLEALLQFLLQKGQEFIDFSLSQKSEDAVAEIRSATDDIKALIDCLMDLALAIEDVPVIDEAETPSEPEVENFMVLSPEAHVYCGRIRDRFRNAPKWLVERLGEANASRSRLISARQPKEEQAYTVIETDKRTTGTSELPSENVFSNFTGTGSATASDRVFDIAVSRPRPEPPTFGGPSRDDDTHSVISFSSVGTTQSVLDQGRARVPPLPKGASNGHPFNCLACSGRVVITTRDAWKQHIFTDLKPFVCTIRDCSWKASENVPQTKSMQAWVIHELTHRGETWRAEICPLCTDSATTYTTTKSFFTHLGKHLKEISLAALPTLQHEYDEESQDEASDVDGDVDLLPPETWTKSGVAAIGSREKSHYNIPGSYPSEVSQGQSPLLQVPQVQHTSHQIVLRPLTEDGPRSHTGERMSSERSNDYMCNLSLAPPMVCGGEGAVGPMLATSTFDPSMAASQDPVPMADYDPYMDRVTTQSYTDCDFEANSSFPQYPDYSYSSPYCSGSTQQPGNPTPMPPENIVDSFFYDESFIPSFDNPPLSSTDWTDQNVPFSIPNSTLQADEKTSGDAHKHIFVCREPGCTSKGFRRKADFERHTRNVHAPDPLKYRFPCDYLTCAGRRDPFFRRDHYRDHLRDFHREDLSRRNEAAEGSDWLSTRSISKTWWRCVKCLERVSVEEHGNECPRCKVQLTEVRRRIRGLA